MANVICQLGAVCRKYCTHKWPHEPTATLSCSDDGCSRADTENSYGLTDEFGQVFARHILDPAYCVDFEYFIRNTGHGQMIVTKGTVFEGYLKRVAEWKEIEESRRQERWLAQVERTRQKGVDLEYGWRLREKAQYIELNQEHNPSLVQEEDTWIGRNYGNWG